MIRLEMKNCDMILTEEAANISALLSGNIEKQEYLTVEEILPSNQREIIV